MGFEILTVVAAICSILSFCGLNARWISQLIKRHVTWNRFNLFLVAAVTAGVLYVQVLSVLYLRPVGWGLAALTLWFLLLVWQPLIDIRFSSHILLRKVMSLIASYGIILALIVVFITWDESVWHKAASIGGGFTLGIAARVIVDYIRKRRATGRESSHKTLG